MTDYERYAEEERDIAMGDLFCFHCGKWLAGTHAGAAHIIANTIPNQNRYGRWVLANAMNLRPACNGACNDAAMGQARGDMERDLLARAIAREILAGEIVLKIPQRDRMALEQMAAGRYT